MLSSDQVNLKRLKTLFNVRQTNEYIKYMPNLSGFLMTVPRFPVLL